MLWDVHAAFVTYFYINVIDICNLLPIKYCLVVILACNCDHDADTNHKRANFLNVDFVKAFDLYQLHAFNCFQLPYSYRVDFGLNIFSQGTGFTWKFTIFVPECGLEVEEEHPYKFSEI